MWTYILLEITPATMMFVYYSIKSDVQLQIVDVVLNSALL